MLNIISKDSCRVHVINDIMKKRTQASFYVGECNNLSHLIRLFKLCKQILRFYEHEDDLLRTDQCNTSGTECIMRCDIPAYLSEERTITLLNLKYNC